MIYSKVTCSKCQRPCWNIAYIGYRVVCVECFELFAIGPDKVRLP